MIVKKLFLVLCAGALLAACVDNGGGEKPVESQALDTPLPVATISGSKATIRWTTVTGARSYAFEIYEGTDSAPVTGEVRTSSHSFDMAEGVTCRFRVKAIAPTGGSYKDSEWSEEVSVSNLMLSTPEATLDEASVTLSTARLSWTAVDAAAGYEYEYYGNDAPSQISRGNTDALEVELTGLSEGVTYKFRVKATASGERLDSSFSPEVQFTTRRLVVMGVPTASVLFCGRTSASISWNTVASAAGYAYELFEGGGTTGTPVKSASQSGTDVTLEELDMAATYTFRVKTLSDPDDSYAVDSEWSESVQFTTLDASAVEIGLPLANENDGVVRAFPGAEGGGMHTTGGRGGAVYHVTNLNDSGPGSLREAVGKTGARTIVFDVAGTIRLQSRLRISSGDLTIAGQTAPGGGICLRDNSVYVGADNVIIRYVRFRMGDVTNVEDDAIWGRYQKNIVLDHCSMSWSTDECASFYANQNFTMQWCLITESLRVSVHGKGNHGYGGIWGGKNASFHHNMLANHDSRNARLDHPQIYANYLATHRGNVDYRNNVIYNWGGNTTYGGEDGRFNVVGNYYKPGPASSRRNYFVDAYNNSNSTQYDYGQFYLQDNYYVGNQALNENNRNGGVYLHQGTGHGSDAVYLDSPLSIRADDTKTCRVSTHPSSAVFEAVVNNVGAALVRDAVDARAARDARSGTATFTDGGNGSKNGIIDTQEAVGGWPALTATAEQIARAATDTDADGIPDYYEELLGLDRNNASDTALKTLDPSNLYSNFEVYLHYLVKEITARQVQGAAYGAL